MISWKTIVKGWDDFFFRHEGVEVISFFRIIWCLIVLASTLCDLPNINDFYGPHAFISLGTVKGQFNYPHINIFHLFNTGYSALYAFVTLYIASTIFSLLGLYTRTSLVLMFICMASFHQRNIWLLSSSELLMRTITIFLVCSPCGNAFSLDSWLSKKYSKTELPRQWAPWAMRLIQIQLSVIYIWTVWHKLKGDNWLDGTAVYYATRLEDMTNFKVPYLLDSVLFLKLATWGTLFTELSIGLLIWIKEFRKWMILLGVLFHLGIEYTMSIPFFEINMLALLFVFLRPEEVTQFVNLAQNKIINSKLSVGLRQKIVQMRNEV